MDGALTDMMGGAPQDADLSAPVAVPGGSATPPALTGDQHPLATDDSYEGRFGLTLRALDQRVQTSKVAAQAAQRETQATSQAASAAADRHVAVMSEQQRRMGALGGDQQNGPQGALPGNQPPMSLQQYLDKHDDDTYNDAVKMVKDKHGSSPDEIYDKMIADKYIPPADVPLTKRQKGEAFMHMGLEILQNTSSKPGQGNALGAFAKGGEAFLQSTDRSHQQAAQQAHEEYLREQGLTLDKAKESSQRQKDEDIALRQIAGDKAKNSEAWRQTQYVQGQENARKAEEIAAKDRETAAARGRTEGEKNVQTQVDATTGYLLERDRKTGKWVNSIGADGKPFKPQSQAKFEATEADKAKTADTRDTAARTKYVEDQKKGIGLYKDDGTQKTDDELKAEYDDLQKKGSGGSTKTVQFSSWK